MKKIIPYLLLILIASACKKMDFSGFRDEIKGEWEYVTFFGYGVPRQVLPPGNGRIIEFGGDDGFKRRQHDTVLFKGTYSLQKKKDCYGDVPSIFLETNDPGFPNGYVVSRSGDSLFISTSNCLIDGGSSMYRRL